MFTPTLFCRFCAQVHPDRNLLDFKTDQTYRPIIIKNLSVYNEEIIDFTNEYLPETVCTACYTNLSKSYEFFAQTRQAQDVLNKLFNGEETKDVSNANIGIVKEEFDLEHENEGTERDIRAASVSSIKGPISWSAYQWSCAHCNTTLPSLDAVREHNQKHHKTCFGFHCADCGVNIDKFAEFVDHVLKERKDLIDCCVYCNIKIETPAHRETHETDDQCTYCGQTFDTELSLIEHLKEYATKMGGTLNYSIQSWSEYPRICIFCNIRKGSPRMLKAHCLSTHMRCFGMKCIDCDDGGISTFDEFVQHVVARHRPNLKHICQYCDATDVAEDHISSHKGRHQCKICGQNFCRASDLRRHDNRLETPVLGPPRQRRTTPITDEDLVCNICGKKMQNPASLRAHKLVHTERNRDHTCDRCGKAFFTKATFLEHLKLHKNDTKTELCRICNKLFMSLRYLRRHVRTHVLEKKYQCDHCKKFYFEKARLRNHMRVHLDVKPFKCAYCFKTFKGSNTLKTHEYQHTGVRPYSCDVCFLEFTCFSNCDKHMKRMHGKGLGKTVLTPHGMMLIDPETGKPTELNMTSGVKEWSRNILEKPSRKRGSVNKDQNVS